MTQPDDVATGTTLFHEVVAPLLDAGRLMQGTMMGHRCVRSRAGGFVAMPDARTGDLIVKLPAQRVRALVDAGLGAPFAPAGRVFREWLSVPGRDRTTWQARIEEAARAADA